MSSEQKSPTTLLETDTPDAALSLVDHLEELRRRLGLCLLAFLVAVGASFSHVETLIGWLKRPAGELLPRFVFFAPTEALGAYIKVAGLSGLLLSMPVIL